MHDRTIPFYNTIRFIRRSREVFDTDQLENLLFAVRDDGRVSSLHWLVVQEQYQREGIGRAI